MAGVLAPCPSGPGLLLPSRGCRLIWTLVLPALSLLPEYLSPSSSVSVGFGHWHSCGTRALIGERGS